MTEIINPQNSDKPSFNRRKILTSLGMAGLLMVPNLLTVQAGTAVAKKSKPTLGKFYGTVADIKLDAGLKEGEIVRAAGYHHVGDGGGGEYLIQKTGKTAEENINLPNGLTAALINVSAVNYKMFGAVGDGQHDDGIEIKRAHLFANQTGLPVVNLSGEFWLKEPNNIPVQTNVQWGHTKFYIDEKFSNNKDVRFIVESREKPSPINLDAAAKARLISQIKPGVSLIPELAPYKNNLVIISDANDRIGVRSGDRYGGRQARAREELFFVEEHGRILGDIAWEFKDYTNLVAYPGNDSYLIIDGGSFHVSGEGPNKSFKGYTQTVFSISRSRTIIRNQWVGLEKGKADVTLNQRSGFYTFRQVYDVTLENVRLIPWEKNRPGDNKVPEGTYGIGGNHILNATFRNVTAEGSPVHWGVFGTNLNKNFRVEQCTLNRIDVHFHCWNLYVRDSKIGTNGITITGGGDLFIDNTTCNSSSFINFRNDYGAKWDGHIRLRNCRHQPITNGMAGIFSFMADNFDYKYPIGYGRSIKVEDMVVDYNAAPQSNGTYWLMRTSAFSKTTEGHRVFFPADIAFRNIVVEGREKGVRLWEITDPQSYKLAKAGGYNGVQVKPNASILFENIPLEILEPQEPQSEEQVHFSLRNTSKTKYFDTYALYPEIRFVRCHGLAGHFGGHIADASFEFSLINRLTGSTGKAMPGSLTFNNCKFEPEIKDNGQAFYSLASELGTSFSNCTLFAPVVNKRPRPELINRYGFIQLNKTVRYNHSNTRLGNDLLQYSKAKGIKLSPGFMALLQANYEMTPGLT